MGLWAFSILFYFIRLELHMYGIAFMRKHIAYVLIVLFHSSNDANQGQYDTF